MEPVQSHDRRAHSAQLLYQPVRLSESSRRTMAQDYPKPKLRGRHFATVGSLPAKKRGANFENYKTNAYLLAAKKQN